MEFPGSAEFDGIRVFERPTPEERRAMQFGKCILLKHYVDDAPLCISYGPPTHSHLQGYVEGELLVRYQVDYPPPPFSGRLASDAYLNRIQRAAIELGSYLEEL